MRIIQIAFVCLFTFTAMTLSAQDKQNKNLRDYGIEIGVLETGSPVTAGVGRERSGLSH